MTGINIYLSPDLGDKLHKNLEELGYVVHSGEITIDIISNLSIKLAILGSDMVNHDLCTIINNESETSIILINHYSKSPFTEEQQLEVDPLAIYSLPITINELKLNLDTIFHLLSYKDQEKRENIWFNGVLNSSKDAIVAIDGESNIKFMNPIAQQLIGIEEDVAIGMSASRVLKFRESSGNDYDLTDKGLEAHNFDAEVYNRASKEYYHIAGYVTPLYNDEGVYCGKVLTLKDVGEIKALFSRINYQTSHDNLTGLLNRRSFIEYADKLINLARYEESVHGLLVLSLDKFKVINDTCGHIAGDELLRKISYILREIDTENRYTKGRISGDEFAILLEGATISEIKHITKKIKRKISHQDFIWGKKEFPIRCSYGIVTINKHTENHYTLFAAADDACSIAKEKGGGKIEIYNKTVDEYHRRRYDMEWIHKLKDAIRKNRFKLYYQEIEAVDKKDLKKIEILVRLQDEDGNIISPLDFIPPAEQYGIMPEIDKIVIEQSVAACKKIIDNKSISTKYIFSVNISGTSIPDRSLPGYIISTFQKYKVPPTLFCFEITETATIRNMDEASNFISKLKQIGCTFSLDDFGSGLSNFTYLKTMDVDFLKIDGSFIKDMLDEPINRAMVESINNFGHILKMKTVAEFVTSEEIKSELIKIGVDYLQGYVICKPTPIEELLL